MNAEDRSRIYICYTYILYVSLHVYICASFIGTRGSTHVHPRGDELHEDAAPLVAAIELRPAEVLQLLGQTLRRGQGHLGPALKEPADVFNGPTGASSWTWAQEACVRAAPFWLIPFIQLAKKGTLNSGCAHPKGKPLVFVCWVGGTPS